MKPRPIIVPIGPSIAYVPLTRGLFALIDLSDMALVEGKNWHARHSNEGSKNDAHYAYRSHRRDTDIGYRWTGLTIMHQVIAGHAGVDHRDPFRSLDNRRANLRAANKSQQGHNQRIRKDNTSGLKGAFYRKDSGKWRAIIGIDGKIISLGQFDSAEQAHAAYRAKAVEVYGEFARLS